MKLGNLELWDGACADKFGVTNSKGAGAELAIENAAGKGWENFLRHASFMVVEDELRSGRIAGVVRFDNEGVDIRR
jgi:hypothetical protein